MRGLVAPHATEGIGGVIGNARMVLDVNDVVGQDGLSPAHMDCLGLLAEEEVVECLAVGLDLNGGAPNMYGANSSRENLSATKSGTN